MAQRLSLIFGAAAWVVTWSGPIAAQEYSNGGKGAAGRKAATLTPVEAFGVHPPGLAPADARHWKPYVPYYAPLSPVGSSTRWKPWSYHPLFPYYTPYYLGYCPHRLFNPRPRPYGSNGWGKGPMPEQHLPADELDTPLRYGGYTSVLDDDTTYWNLGGNGLVPYGADRPATAVPPDLIDAIQSSRPRRGHAHFHRAHSAHPPAIATPVETEGESEGGEAGGFDRSHPRRTAPAEPIPPGEPANEPAE